MSQTSVIKNAMITMSKLNVAIGKQRARNNILEAECKKHYKKYKKYLSEGRNKLASQQLKLVRQCKKNHIFATNAVKTFKKQRKDLVRKTNKRKRFETMKLKRQIKILKKKLETAATSQGRHQKALHENNIKLNKTGRHKLFTILTLKRNIENHTAGVKKSTMKLKELADNIRSINSKLGSRASGVKTRKRKVKGNGKKGKGKKGKSKKGKGKKGKGKKGKGKKGKGKKGKGKKSKKTR